MTELRLILASASPARTKLLRDAGISHEVLVSDVDEDAVTARHGLTDARDTALLLARAKAEAIAALPEAGDALVLGCDSVFELDGKAYGKPYTADVARTRIGAMSGNSGLLHTGHWLVDNRPLRAAEEDDDELISGDGAPANRDVNDDGDAGFGSGATIGAVATAAVYFATLTPAEIDAYVATGEPLQVAGSFTIDSLGGAFIERVDGDPHAVVGLSISTLRTLLASAGVGITELWR